jgi:hydroxymethylglutaryl-CoA lyase
MSRAPAVRIVEVSPRDGLQNEARVLAPQQRAIMIEALAAAGLRTIEAGSFVSASRLPQMAGTAEVLSRLGKMSDLRLPVLVPNLRGLTAALAAGAREIAIFAAASESFSQHNLNRSIADSLTEYEAVVRKAAENQIRVRGYVSCILGCPYDGKVPVAQVVQVAARLRDMGCYEISLGDTIGVGTADRAREVVRAVAKEIGAEHVALHFHDTYGQALANVLACLDLGISVIDASAAGLGGCPYAPGASGNLATEDLVYMLDGLGVATGVDLKVLTWAGAMACEALGTASRSRAGQALMAHKGGKEDACTKAV